MSVDEVLCNKCGQVNKKTRRYCINCGAKDINELNIELIKQHKNYGKKSLETSIIIRTKNEERYLEQVLLKLKKQTYKNFEIVIVDDNSTDKTLEIAKKYNCKIVKIPEGKFTYPYACNFGIRESIGENIVFLSGHSIPINTKWLENGLNNFKNEKVAGVYGYPLMHYGVSLFENIMYFFSRDFGKRRFIINNVKNMKIGRLGPYFHIFLFQWFPITVAKKMKIGSLGFTNAIIRRDLWEKYNINEKFAGGGEDHDWARHWVAKGFVIVHEPNFKVYHSHHHGLIGWLNQFIGWTKMTKEMEFKPQKRNF